MTEDCGHHGGPQTGHERYDQPEIIIILAFAPNMNCSLNFMIDVYVFIEYLREELNTRSIAAWKGKMFQFINFLLHYFRLCDTYARPRRNGRNYTRGSYRRERLLG